MIIYIYNDIFRSFNKNIRVICVYYIQIPDIFYLILIIDFNCCNFFIKLYIYLFP